MEEKTILEKIKEILKDNEIIYTMLVPIINFLYTFIKSYIFSFKYSIPIEFVEINIKIILGNFIVVFCIFVFSLLILYILNAIENNKKENNKKNKIKASILVLVLILIIVIIEYGIIFSLITGIKGIICFTLVIIVEMCPLISKRRLLITKIESKIKSIEILAIFLLFEVIIILLILVNKAYSLTRVTIWIWAAVFFVIVIVMNTYFIFFKRNLFIIFIKYIILVAVLANFIPENFKVITYKDENKNTKKVIAMGYRDGEYLALDYDENKGEIYKVPAYSISASEIEEIELRKINDLKPVLSRKIDNISNEESGNNE